MFDEIHRMMVPALLLNISHCVLTISPKAAMINKLTHCLIVLHGLFSLNYCLCNPGNRHKIIVPGNKRFLLFAVT